MRHPFWTRHPILLCLLGLTVVACGDVPTAPTHAIYPSLQPSLAETPDLAVGCELPDLLHDWPADGNSVQDLVGDADLDTRVGRFTDDGRSEEAFSTARFVWFKHKPTTPPVYVGDFTVELWVRPDVAAENLPDFAGVFATTDAAGVIGGFQIEKCGFPGSLCTADTYSLNVRTTAGDVELSFGPIVEEWRHLAVTYAASTGEIVTYYQGVPVSSDIFSDPLRIDLVKLGVNRDTTRWFTGSIDEVRVFGRVLSPEEVLRIFQADGGDCGSDVDGPVTSRTTLNPGPVQVGSAIELSAVVDDASTGGSDVAMAEYSVDGSAFAPMSALDGSYDSAVEHVIAEIPGLSMQAVGTSEICVRGVDAPGNVGAPECIPLVVYDAVGSVNGGGWIEPPAGASPAEPNLTGRGYLQFIARYRNGETVPSGEARFRIRRGDLELRSTSYELLMITGQSAELRGLGTVNGKLSPSGGAYRFTIWTTDDRPDTFRIKIWWEDGGEHVVYDNGTEVPLSGGAIVVRGG